MNDTTWVKLYRKSLANDVRRHDPTAWRLFETLMMLVDSRTGKWSGGRYQLVEADGNLNGSTIYKALHRLEATGMISINSNTRYTEISICKWSNYTKAGNTSSNNKVTTNEQQSNTLTRSKEVRSKNNINTISKANGKQMELLKVLNEETSRNLRVYPTDKRAARTHTLFTPEEVRTALRKMKTDEWHKTKMAQLKAGYLLSADNIDKFLNFKSAIEQSVRSQPAKTISSQFNKLDVGMTAKERLAKEYAN